MRYSVSKYSVTLKTGLGVVQCHWKWRRSIDHMTFYWSAIVNIALSGTVFELFQLIWRWMISWPWNLLEPRGHSRSFKLVPFKSLGMVSYWPSIATMALSCIICNIKRVIGRKSWFFSYPSCIRRPRYVGAHRNIAILFGFKKPFFFKTQPGGFF